MIGPCVVEDADVVVPEEDDVEVGVVVVGDGDVEVDVPVVGDVTGPIGVVAGEEDDVEVGVGCVGAGAGAVRVEAGDVVCAGTDVGGVADGGKELASCDGFSDPEEQEDRRRTVNRRNAKDIGSSDGTAAH